jgi:hypothetical protein
MNLNNKFGNCCGCPALNNAREFTEHRSSSIYNSEIMKKITTTSNSHDYRQSLQNNGESIIRNLYNNFETNYKCKNNGSNVFYIDSTNFHSSYENLNTKK